MSIDHSPKVLYVKYTEKPALYNCFMSFCRDGGLFVPGSNLTGIAPHLGTQLNMLVELPGDPNLYTASGKISWINMEKRKGIGIRLTADEQGQLLRNAIENNLAGMIKSPSPTYTM